ncbi:hypothetical protein [Emticicia sp. 17c]|uniref:hypothetical protein n=1 Tax=Emticicia sp. 17c TaxID=3127704 RepID=UPI00301E5FAE
MFEKVTNWLVTYVSFILLLPIVVVIYRRKYLKKELIAIGVYMAFTIFSQVVAIVGSKIFKNNLPYLHFYTIVDFGLISWFYKEYLGTFLNPKIIYANFLFFTLLAVLNVVLKVQSIYEYNSYPRGLECIFVVFYAIVAYYKTIKSLEIISIEKSPLFWINAGFLFYFAGSLFLFVLGNLILKQDVHLSMLSWAIHACLWALMYIFIAIGLWHSPRQ